MYTCELTFKHSFLSPERGVWVELLTRCSVFIIAEEHVSIVEGKLLEKNKGRGCGQVTYVLSAGCLNGVLGDAGGPLNPRALAP